MQKGEHTSNLCLNLRRSLQGCLPGTFGHLDLPLGIKKLGFDGIHGGADLGDRHHAIRLDHLIGLRLRRFHPLADGGRIRRLLGHLVLMVVQRLRTSFQALHEKVELVTATGQVPLVTPCLFRAFKNMGFLKFLFKYNVLPFSQIFKIF